MHYFGVSRGSKISLCLLITLFISSIIMPLWALLFLLASSVIFSKGEYRVAFTLPLIFVSAIYNSGVDINGDLSNYQYLYYNLDRNNIASEFGSEPTILYIFKLFGFFELEFESALIFQSIFFNLFIALSLWLSLGGLGLVFFALITIFPPYIQMSLYLYRQSVSIVFFIVVLFSQRKFIRITFAILSILSHSASIFYVVVCLMKNYLLRLFDYRIIIFIFVMALLFPLNNETIMNVVSSFKQTSSVLDRKINFFLRSDELSSSFSLYSSILIPLHITFLSVIYLTYKDRKFKPDIVIFSFVILYFVLLFTRNFSLLPTRLSMLIIMLSPVFMGNIYIQYKDKFLKYLLIAYVAFCCISFIRFNYINDVGSNNISFYKRTVLDKYIFR
ncbi:EpsG family protein [Vibrio fluvialis]|nr:EpsG family protein [Vibrio fluvialis]MBY7774584.1 EpsG family protein [Vibrio fluvialis]MBY7778776.1 EpsG family protein [Vibrio fluvialis]MBY7988194.1 EpsG family protein [Vibrio fluvialis]MBY7993774.1 EpsG family protein [Vibrio fluvialis]